jgi:hypothetical protein
VAWIVQTQLLAKDPEVQTKHRYQRVKSAKDIKKNALLVVLQLVGKFF